MRTVALLFCLAGQLLLAESSNRLTLLLQFEERPSTASISALDLELKSILSVSHVPLQVTLRTQPLTGDLSGDLVVFKMKGTCSMNVMPIAALLDERGPLGSTHMVDGEMLPFAEVQCDRVRQSVQRLFGRGNPQSHQIQLGTALARVMAHELYHILSKSSAHDSAGLTKKSLSSRELSTGTMVLSDTARSAISPQ